jgi:hypothetical protein
VVMGCFPKGDGGVHAVAGHKKLFLMSSWRYKQRLMHYCACLVVCNKVHVLGLLK